MRRAVSVGRRSGQHRRAALARRNLAVYLAYAGKATEARREIDAASAALTGLDRARTEVFRIAVFGATGLGPADVDESGPALRALRARTTGSGRRGCSTTAGLLFSDLGDVGRARARPRGGAGALRGARAPTPPSPTPRSSSRGCGSSTATRSAASPSSTASTSRALSDWAACWLYLSRAEASVALRLLEEARADLARFVETSAAAGAVDSVTKARLDAAELSLLAGDPASAASLAAGARRSFAARRQPVDWARAVLTTLGPSSPAACAARRCALRSMRRRCSPSAVTAATRCEGTS